MSTALLLSGGAPNATLMAGALKALHEQGVTFDVISTSGAGAVVGLAYAAPKDMTPDEGLENLINMGVSDEIFNIFPINYKVFYKPGPLADMYRQLWALNPWYMKMVDQRGDISSMQRLMSDWMQFVINSCAPNDMNPNGLGTCAHAPFMDHIVDFDRLRSFAGKFYINAYNITDKKMQNWDQSELTKKHFAAAMSFPFLYAPTEIDGKWYFEGATVDALNYKALVDNHPEVDTIVVFDVMGSDDLVRKPRNLYDAWVISIVTPIVELAKDDTKLFELVHNQGAKRKLLKVQFDIPEEHLPKVMDWSYSNLKTLYDVGYASGQKFYQEHKSDLQVGSAKKKAANS